MQIGGKYSGVLLPLRVDVTPAPTHVVLSRVGRSRGADRASLKVHWNQVLEDAKDAIQLARAESYQSRPRAEQLFEILDEAATLPVPEQAPGGNEVAHPVHPVFLTLAL